MLHLRVQQTFLLVVAWNQTSLSESAENTLRPGHLVVEPDVHCGDVWDGYRCYCTEFT